jgi:hypothetical protein
MTSGVLDSLVHLSDRLVHKLDGALTMPALVGFRTFEGRSRFLKVVACCLHVRLTGARIANDRLAASASEDQGKS